MSATRQVPDPAAVAWWLDTLKNHQGCMRLAPDPADPLAAAAYNEARRQLAAQAKTEAGAEPEPTPLPAPPQNKNRTQLMTTTEPAPVMYRIRDVVKLTRLSRSVIYEQIRAGRLRAVKQGTATLITAAALDDYVRLLEQEARSRH